MNVPSFVHPGGQPTGVEASRLLCAPCGGSVVSLLSEPRHVLGPFVRPSVRPPSVRQSVVVCFVSLLGFALALIARPLTS